MPRKKAGTKKATGKKGGKKKAAAPTPVENELTKTHAALNKVFKKQKSESPVVAINTDDLDSPRAHIPSGSIVLDYLIGGIPNRKGIPPCPGWPRGALSQIYGHESSGKTTVALMAAASVCQRGGNVMFIDWENAVDFAYAEALGVPIQEQDKFLLLQPNTMEDGFKAIYVAAMHGVTLIILDSIGACVPEATFNQSVDEQGELGRVGLLAAKWSKFLPKLSAIVNKTGTHVMGLSQLRERIGGFGGFGAESTTQQGGRAWKFYSSIRMKFTRIAGEKGKVHDAIQHKVVEKMLASKIKAKVDKSKVSQSQQHENYFWITFGEGIDDIRSCIEIATNYGAIQKGGAWFTWERANGDTIKQQGLSSFRTALDQAEGAHDELRTLASRLITQTPEDYVVSEEDGLDLDLDELIGMSTADLGDTLDSLVGDEG